MIKTTITNAFTIDIPDLSEYKLIMEGISCPSRFYVASAYRPQFIKCHLPDIDASHERHMHDAVFINCVLGFYGANYPITAINCVFLDEEEYGISITAYNCILKGWDSYSGNAFFYNCIFKHRCSTCSRNIEYQQNCLSIDSYESIFKEYRGTYTDGISFELQDSIAVTYLGTDSS